MTPDQKAREAAAVAFGGLVSTSFEVADGWEQNSVRESVSAAIDAYLAVLAPVPDEQLAAIEAEIARMHEVGLDFHTDQTATLLAEIRRLRALSSHPDEETASGHQRDRDGICSCCGQGLTALDIVDGERPCERPGEETEPDEETVTSEPDVTWPGDLRPDSRVRSSRALIREANAVRDLDGTGIVGRLADMLAGWLPARPTPEGSETA